MTATARIYDNICFTELAAILSMDARRAEKVGTYSRLGYNIQCLHHHTYSSWHIDCSNHDHRGATGWLHRSKRYLSSSHHTNVDSIWFIPSLPSIAEHSLVFASTDSALRGWDRGIAGICEEVALLCCRSSCTCISTSLDWSIDYPSLTNNHSATVGVEIRGRRGEIFLLDDDVCIMMIQSTLFR